APSRRSRRSATTWVSTRSVTSPSKDCWRARRTGSASATPVSPASIRCRSIRAPRSSRSRPCTAPRERAPDSRSPAARRRLRSRSATQGSMPARRLLDPPEAPPYSRRLMSLPELMRQRREKLAQWRALGVEPYAYRFEPTHRAAELLARGDQVTADPGEKVAVAGRIMTLRGHGKAGFAHLLDA